MMVGYWSGSWGTVDIPLGISLPAFRKGHRQSKRTL